MTNEDPNYSELEDDSRPETLDYVRARWSQLSTASRDARKDAVKFIGVINAGGAATMLTFMGALLSTRSDLAKSFLLRAALISFVVGVCFSALAHAVENARISGLFAKWRTEVGRFYDDQIGFTSLRQEDIKRADDSDVTNFFVGIAIAAFIIGAVLGVVLLLEGG
jgi:hypothetical protein